MRTIIYPEWLLDGTGGPARVGQALAFAEGRIEAVGPAEDMRVDDGDEVLRCPGETLLPGLINMHVHLSLASDNTPFVPYMDAHSDVALALRGSAQCAGRARGRHYDSARLWCAPHHGARAP
jgi:imidazolonepropionase-like amidohydrolase